MYTHEKDAQGKVNMEMIHCNMIQLFEQLRSFINVASSDCRDPFDAGLADVVLYFKASIEWINSPLFHLIYFILFVARP